MEKTNEFSLDIEEKEVRLGFNVWYIGVFESSFEGVLIAHSSRGLNNRYLYLWLCIYGSTLNYRLNIYISLKVLNRGHKEVFGGIMEDFCGDPFEWLCVDVFALVLSLLDIAS